MDLFQILMEKQNQYYQIRQQKQQQLQPQQKNYVQLDAKGLENKFGENNCFLNVVIQALWQLSSFRNKFNNWEKHSHKDEKQASNCVHCALKSVFIQYQYSETPLIPPTTLRSALHHTFANEERFQIGQMDDAAETLEAILNCLEDVSDEEDGIPRCVFGIDLEKSVFCANCKSQSKPEISSHFIEYTYSSPLLRLLAFDKSNSRDKNDRLENLIKIVGQEWKSCPREDSNGNPICKEKLLVTNKLLNVPEILAIGIVWETTQPSVDEILGTLNLIQNQITINRLFTLDYKNDIYFRFRGMICYYGKHYACYFFDEKIGQWIVFDDATVKIVGDWQNVLFKSKLGHFHPSVLLYERNPGQSVPPRVPVRIPEPNIQIPSIPEIQNKLLQFLNIHHDVSFSQSNDQSKKGYQTINVQSKTINLPPPKKGYSYL